jgi:L,D-peptidoglycan transpeptidase YkuD (ErfK/YbiS/YcfS/YnhG family)
MSTIAPAPSSALDSTPVATPRSTSASMHRSSKPAAGTHHAHAPRLPLSFGTGAATQVITVVASSTSSTEGTLQAWRKAAGVWQRVGTPVHAWLGSDGLSAHPSETRSATPIGSFTLTRAFGHDSNPGTSLPYTHTTPADWWISEPGADYNTLQHCSAGCPFAQGDPNEHLYYETPYYDYAVVIDYNTPNAPGGVRQGAGSAFFLHVTVGRPTQGCISVPPQRLVGLLRWLTPAAHPRILIGTA